MLKRVSLLVALLFLFQSANSDATCYYSPRGSIWGLAGSENQARLDLLLPILSNSNNLLYTDVQGGYAKDDGSYAGIGAGFRKLVNNSVIYGGYFFVDRDESKLHNVFTVLSPGVEAIFPCWDFRVNGYFPVSQHHKTVEFFPSQFGNYSAVVFQGHQQFEHRFATFEKAGVGGDAEVGYTFHRLRDTQLHAGVYYFNFDNRHIPEGYSRSNITGIEGRLEIPVNPHWAVTVESSYDNYHGSTLVGGLRFNFAGARPHKPCDMHYHMVEPITRNVGSLYTGSGIPTVENQKDEGLVLQRSNIYFFTSQGGTTLADPSADGSFEKPYRSDQFSQDVVNAIGPNANFYFNPGVYAISGNGDAPNAQINLPFGDSIYGRGSVDWKSPVIGDARPTLLGRINLYAGNNTIDSMQLVNQIIHPDTDPVNVIALDAEHVSNITLNNDVISASNTIIGNNYSKQGAFAIQSQYCQINIINSTINSNVHITGDNVEDTFSLDFDALDGNNIISIQNSTLNAAGSSDGDNVNGLIFAANIFSTNIVTPDKKAHIFSQWGKSNNNTFYINNCELNAKAHVAGINDEADGELDSYNVILNNQNHLNIANSHLSAESILEGDNNDDQSLVGSCNISLEGGNTVNFDNCTFNSASIVKGDNNGWNSTDGFIFYHDSTVNINNCKFNMAASVEKNNFRINGILGFEMFENVTLKINNSQFNMNAVVMQDNLYHNTINAFEEFGGGGSNIVINNSECNCNAIVAGNSEYFNEIDGFIVNPNNATTINGSVFNLVAKVGQNTGIVNDVVVNGGGGDFIVSPDSQINVIKIPLIQQNRIVLPKKSLAFYTELKKNQTPNQEQ